MRTNSKRSRKSINCIELITDTSLPETEVVRRIGLKEKLSGLFQTKEVEDGENRPQIRTLSWKTEA